MKFTTAALVSLVAAAASAAPAPAPAAEAVSMVAAVPQWTFTSFTRTCNQADTACDVSFGVDTKVAPPTHCAYTVRAPSQASRAPVNGVVCGPYTISSGWSGQFEVGFTTWSVVDWSKRLITWPAYTDLQLVNGQPVSPDQSYAPQSI